MTGVSLTVQPISAADHLAFVRTQRSVSFLQTPAWGDVKTEWRSESLGWYDDRRLVGAGLVLHRPVPRLERFTLAYLPQGPTIDWTGDLDTWLAPLAAYLKARGAFAIRLGPPVRTDTWSAPQVKEGIADPGIKRLPDLPSQEVDPVGANVARATPGRRLATAVHGGRLRRRAAAVHLRAPAGRTDRGRRAQGHEPALAPQHQEGGQGGRRGHDRRGHKR